MDKFINFLEKKCRGGVRGGVEIETTMSIVKGPSSGRPRAPGIEENRNAKRCSNWIRVDAGEMAVKRETTMSATEGPSSSVVNPMLETSLSYGPPWAHCLGGYQDRLLSGPLGLLGLCHTAPDGVGRKDYGGKVLR
jgi:hypothetical protein